MQHDNSSRFQRFLLEEGELNAALAVSPYFLAYLQNKIADYADAVIEFEKEPGMTAEEAILAHEKLKAKVIVLEELFREVQPPRSEDSTQPN